MKRESVDSSAVRSAGYDEKRLIMEIEFASGDVYEYLGVPVSVFVQFLNAASKGQFVNAVVKPLYTFHHVSG